MYAYLLILITFGLMWLLVIRPQKRRMAEHQAVVASLEPGLSVITTSGIYGTIEAIDDDVVTLLVAPDVRIRIAAGAIGSVEAPESVEDAEVAGSLEVAPSGIESAHLVDAADASDRDDRVVGGES